jgi:hypothetical protein
MAAVSFSARLFGDGRGVPDANKALATRQQCVMVGSSRPCPVDGCKKRLLLSAMIVHLNDHHQWSRERIADWLEENGVEKPAAAADQPR